MDPRIISSFIESQLKSLGENKADIIANKDGSIESQTQRYKKINAAAAQAIATVNVILSSNNEIGTIYTTVIELKSILSILRRDLAFCEDVAQIKNICSKTVVLIDTLRERVLGKLSRSNDSTIPSALSVDTHKLAMEAWITANPRTHILLQDVLIMLTKKRSNSNFETRLEEDLSEGTEPRRVQSSIALLLLVHWLGKDPEMNDVPEIFLPFMEDLFLLSPLLKDTIKEVPDFLDQILGKKPKLFMILRDSSEGKAKDIIKSITGKTVENPEIVEAARKLLLKALHSKNVTPSVVSIPASKQKNEAQHKSDPKRNSNSQSGPPRSYDHDRSNDMDGIDISPAAIQLDNDNLYAKIIKALEEKELEIAEVYAGSMSKGDTQDRAYSDIIKSCISSLAEEHMVSALRMTYQITDKQLAKRLQVELQESESRRSKIGYGISDPLGSIGEPDFSAEDEALYASLRSDKKDSKDSGKSRGFKLRENYFAPRNLLESFNAAAFVPAKKIEESGWNLPPTVRKPVPHYGSAVAPKPATPVATASSSLMEEAMKRMAQELDQQMGLGLASKPSTPQKTQSRVSASSGTPSAALQPPQETTPLNKSNNTSAAAGTAISSTAPVNGFGLIKDQKSDPKVPPVASSSATVASNSTAASAKPNS